MAGFMAGIVPVNALADAAPGFVYRSGPHLDFMRRRRTWFDPMAVPYLVLWWVPAGHIPGVDEALSRLDLLRRDGPGPQAFSFHHPCPPPVPAAEAAR